MTCLIRFAIAWEYNMKKIKRVCKNCEFSDIPASDYGKKQKIGVVGIFVIDLEVKQDE